MKIIAGIFGALLLSGCGGGNQALLASGGHQDFAEMNRISEEYGTGDPDGTVPITVNGEPYSFRVWISKRKSRIMVQTASLTGAAAAGFVRGLTGGLVKGEQDYEPFRDAATSYLAVNYGPACTLANSRKLTRIGWEWDFQCSVPASKPPHR